MSGLILMPALSPTMEEGTLARWLVKPGDRVKPGDVIAEIETDKAVMELEAVDEGVVARLLVPAGTQGVRVNAPIAELEGAATTSPPAVKPAPPAQAPAKPVSPKPTAPSLQSPSLRGERVRASPLARRLARSEGVALRDLRGTGPHGRIIRQDVEALLARRAKGGGVAAPPPARLDPRVYPRESYELLPLDSVRRVVARRLTDSFMYVPHFPLTTDIEIDRLIETRRQLNVAAASGAKVSLNDMIIKAAAMALMEHPEAHASFTDDGIAHHRSAHISVAVAIEGGLITPVIRDAQTRSLTDIAALMRDLAGRARERRLKPQEYQGGTFSISNLGMFGVRAFSSIINTPESMILSVGEGVRRPVVREGRIEAATLMTVTLTCDHRVVDGATGARWLQTFRTILEAPEALVS